MRDKVLEFIEKNSLVKRNDRIIVALSGGADSVSLFHFLLSIRDEYSLEVYAFHLNHMIRGEDADRDMEFVRDICRKNGVEAFIYSRDIPAIARERKVSTETAGRDIRYMYLKELSEKLGALCATAHTLSDNAETVIFNMARGTSLKGLSGIPVKRGNIIRPLLCVTREEIEEYCENNGLNYVTDSTNFEDIYTRNRIRHSVIPVLKEINKDFFTAVQRLSAISFDAVKHIDALAEEEKKKASLSYGYDRERIALLDDSVRHEVIIKILEDENISPEFDMIHRIDDAITNKSCADISKGYTFTAKQGIIRIIKSTKCESLLIPFKEFHGIRIFEKEDINRLPKDQRKNLVDLSKIGDNAFIRTRREGDVFRLSKRGISKSLKKLMIEEKIPVEFRNSLLILDDGEKILYCEGIGASEYGKVDSTTEKAVEIKYNYCGGSI